MLGRYWHGLRDNYAHAALVSINTLISEKVTGLGRAKYFVVSASY